jgi:hypothetical protein
MKDPRVFLKKIYINTLGDKLVEQLRLMPSARPEEFGTYLEGDILFPSATVQKARTGALLEFRWPQAKIYYLISSSFGK